MKLLVSLFARQVKGLYQEKWAIFLSLIFHVTPIIFVQIWIKNFVFSLLSKCLP